MQLRTLLFAFAACASSPPVTAPQPDGVYRTHVGTTEVTVVSDGTLTLDVAHGLAIGAKDGEIKTSPIDASFNEFVIKVGGRVALIDTGAAATMGPTAGKLPRSLRDAGIRPEDITDVFLTHIHPDHAGGLVVAGAVAFPNATVHVEAADLSYWLDATRAAQATGMMATFFASARASLEPYVTANRIQTFSGPTTFFAGLRAEPAYGHTPGHVVYVLDSGADELRFLGDTIHIPEVQFADPDIAVAFDVDPATAIATRRRILGEVADKHVLVAHDHLPFPGLGHVERAGDQFAWKAVTR